MQGDSHYFICLIWNTFSSAVVPLSITKSALSGCWGQQGVRGLGVQCWFPVHGFHSSVSDLAGRRTSSSFSPRPRRQLQSYVGKK